MTGQDFRPTLRLYGNNLASAGARFWILCASVLILIMATAESVAWGYVASFFGQSVPLRIVVASFVGLSVFAIIWILDATFMTLDLKRSEYEESLHGRKKNREQDRLRFWGGVLGRLALVSGSLYLSAPFLAQLIFQQDIDSRISALNARKLSEQRLILEQEKSAHIDSLFASRVELEDQRIKEAAGKGLSGRYGRGPAVRTIELRLDELSSEIVAARLDLETTLATYDQLTPEEVELRYGTALIGQGLQSRGEVLDQILVEDSYQNAEFAVRAFLFFLFLGLLILKLFQPRSVEVYYSEQLQSLYRRYTGGAFDELLPEAERSQGRASMDALRFEDWCLNSYGLERQEASERRFKARRLQEFEEQVDVLKRVADRSQAELQPIAAQHEQGRARVRAIDAELEALRSHFQNETEELQEQQGHISSIDQNLRDGRLDEEAFKTAARVRAEIAEKEVALARSVRALEAKSSQLAHQRENEVAELVNLDRDLAHKRSLLDGIEATIRHAREEYVSSFLGGEGFGLGNKAREELEDKDRPWQARLLKDGHSQTS